MAKNKKKSLEELAEEMESFKDLTIIDNIFYPEKIERAIEIMREYAEQLIEAADEIETAKRALSKDLRKHFLKHI